MIEPYTFTIGKGENREELSGYLARDKNKKQHIFVWLNPNNKKIEILEMWEGHYKPEGKHGLWLAKNRRFNKVVNFAPEMAEDVAEAVKALAAGKSEEVKERKTKELLMKNMV